MFCYVRRLLSKSRHEIFDDHLSTVDKWTEARLQKRNTSTRQRREWWKAADAVTFGHFRKAPGARHRRYFQKEQFQISNWLLKFEMKQIFLNPTLVIVLILLERLGNAELCN